MLDKTKGQSVAASPARSCHALVWLNGALLEAASARIDPSDRGFTLGDGVFETIRVAAGQPVRFARHLARLRAGADQLGIDLRYTDEAMGEAVQSVLAGRPAGVIRITLSRGPGRRGVLPACGLLSTLLVSAGPLSSPLPPARLILCTRTRRNEFSPLSRIKSLNYLDSIIARREAAASGADDAVLLNTRGTVAEASAATLVALCGGALVTPPVSDGALPGIARAMLLEHGWMTERSLSRAALLTAEAACLVNSLGGRVVASVDGFVLEADHPLMQAVCAFVGDGSRPSEHHPA